MPCLVNATRPAAHPVPAGEGSDDLRSWARHERLSVAMALATVTHHSFPGGAPRTTLYQSQMSVTSAGGMRLPPFVEGRPQVRIPAAHRGAVRRPWSGGPYALHGGAPDGGTVGGTAVSSQISRVCRAGLSRCPRLFVHPALLAQLVLCAPQLAEQLVEVPTPRILFFSGVWSRTFDIPASESWRFLQSSCFPPRTGYNSVACFSGTHF